MYKCLKCCGRYYLKNNICVIGLANDYLKLVAKQLADKLDMFYADVNELLQFDLINIEEARQKSGNEYILGLESKKVKSVSTYDNIIYTMSYSTLTNKNNYHYVTKNSVVIYVRMGDITYKKALKQQKNTENQQKLALVVKRDRNALCKELADIEILARTLNVKTNVKNILKALDKHYVQNEE